MTVEHVDRNRRLAAAHDVSLTPLAVPGGVTLGDDLLSPRLPVGGELVQGDAKLVGLVALGLRRGGVDPEEVGDVRGVAVRDGGRHPVLRVLRRARAIVERLRAVDGHA
jgi:hypothetical protein